MQRDYGLSETEILELEERLGALAESFSTMLVWLLRYCHEKNIPLKEEELPRRMLSRVMSTLNELMSIERLSYLAPIIQRAETLSEAKRKPPDKLPVYPLGGVPPWVLVTSVGGKSRW